MIDPGAADFASGNGALLGQASTCVRVDMQELGGLGERHRRARRGFIGCRLSHRRFWTLSAHDDLQWGSGRLEPNCHVGRIIANFVRKGIP